MYLMCYSFLMHELVALHCHSRIISWFLLLKYYYVIVIRQFSDISQFTKL